MLIADISSLFPEL